jgi:hypothetical protein
MSVTPPMRSSGSRAKLLRVSTPRATATLTLDISLQSEPATGVISAAGVRSRSFTGWIELFGQLDSLLVELGAASAEPAELLDSAVARGADEGAWWE